MDVTRLWITILLAAILGGFYLAAFLAKRKSMKQSAFSGVPFTSSAQSIASLKFLESPKRKTGTSKLRRKRLGNLNLPSGRIVAVDPITLWESDKPFLQSVPPGSYPVDVYWLDLPMWGRCIAFSAIRFSDQLVENWRPAKTFGLENSEKENDAYFGFGVDSGVGSYLSPESVAELLASNKAAEDENPEHPDYYSEKLSGHLDRRALEAMMYTVNSKAKLNIAAFKSGLGDGTYPSFFGYDAKGRPSILATTYLVVDEIEMAFVK